MSVQIIYKSFDDVIPQPHQIVTHFSANVKVGGSYLLQGEFSPSLSFESWLTDANTGENVSKKNILKSMLFTGKIKLNSDK